eukprot:1158878-Pelagomonas_calceolata.AAC.11
MMGRFQSLIFQTFGHGSFRVPRKCICYPEVNTNATQGPHCLASKNPGHHLKVSIQNSCGCKGPITIQLEGEPSNRMRLWPHLALSCPLGRQVFPIFPSLGRLQLHSLKSVPANG